MDRIITRPGAIPLETDLGYAQRGVQMALGYMAEAIFGLGTVFYELNCVPTTPASMQIVVDRGMISQLSTIDATAFGSLPSDSAPMMKVGINTTATLFNMTAPSTPGQSQNFLIQASLSEVDQDPVVLPYYNASNPQVSWSGPNNSGIPQMTHRVQRVALQVVPGAPAGSGSQQTPPVTSGWIPLWIVTLTAGQSSITSSSIVPHPNQPSIPYRLPQLSPPGPSGFRRQVVISSSQVYTFAQGGAIRVTAVGAGGAGAGTSSTGSNQVSVAAGGNGGCVASGVFNLAAGAGINIVVGAAGVWDAGSSTGMDGGTTTVAGLLSAPGGRGGGPVVPANVPPLTQAALAATRNGVGGDINIPERQGFPAIGMTIANFISGRGGDSNYGSGGSSVTTTTGDGNYGQGFGAGGSGGASGPNNGARAGGNGAGGLVILEF